MQKFKLKIRSKLAKMLNLGKLVVKEHKNGASFYDFAQNW